MEQQIPVVAHDKRVAIHAELERNYKGEIN